MSAKPSQFLLHPPTSIPPRWESLRQLTWSASPRCCRSYSIAALAPLLLNLTFPTSNASVYIRARSIQRLTIEHQCKPNTSTIDCSDYQRPGSSVFVEFYGYGATIPDPFGTSFECVDDAYGDVTKHFPLPEDDTMGLDMPVFERKSVYLAFHPREQTTYRIWAGVVWIYDHGSKSWEY